MAVEALEIGDVTKVSLGTIFLPESYMAAAMARSIKVWATYSSAACSFKRS